MGKFYLTLFFYLIALFACKPLVRVDMDSYMHNKEYYEGKRVVFTTDLENVVSKYKVYQGKEVEISAPVTYFGRNNFRTWYLVLEKEGKKIRCYEDEYRIYSGRDALFLIRRAKREGKEVTVRGRLTRDGIELNRLTYKEYCVNTNSKPPEMRIPKFGSYF